MGFRSARQDRRLVVPGPHPTIWGSGERRALPALVGSLRRRQRHQGETASRGYRTQQSAPASSPARAMVPPSTRPAPRTPKTKPSAAPRPWLRPRLTSSPRSTSAGIRYTRRPSSRSRASPFALRRSGRRSHTSTCPGRTWDDVVRPECRDASASNTLMRHTKMNCGRRHDAPALTARAEPTPLHSPDTAPPAAPPRGCALRPRAPDGPRRTEGECWPWRHRASGPSREARSGG